MTEEEIKKLMLKTGIPVPYKFRIIKDTTEFMALDKDDIILLDHIPYLILRNEKEIGFGLDNEPKYWVKRTTNLTSGKLQIVQLSKCLRSLSWLHEHGLVHGDVRWDHILFDREMKRYRWIDFDYFFPENPFGVDLFGIGKILAYVIGKGPYLYTVLSTVTNLNRF
jgi:hypothetical protein